MGVCVCICVYVCLWDWQLNSESQPMERVEPPDDCLNINPLLETPLKASNNASAFIVCPCTIISFLKGMNITTLKYQTKCHVLNKTLFVIKKYTFPYLHTIKRILIIENMLKCDIL